ncbi:hypothetical protein [Thiothrix caldifontis]|uniref:hypothetical protein n=1 Tax=Thiothrix caldifontis TaxID=525918 RepID=UPI001114C25A|nr:hypothetical protein [Thiothrix caldifontis]
MQPPTMVRQSQSIVETAEKDGCPHCGSLVWEQIHRTKLQKVIKPFKGRCYCRACQNEFWKEVD